ncbi:hypothetical protein FB451DRAFT_1371723 [Mycena latifolia]|nr:hypothetical protein FB451DRAFT_1371723 [Mycena latifolia]
MQRSPWSLLILLLPSAFLPHFLFFTRCEMLSLALLLLSAGVTNTIATPRRRDDFKNVCPILDINNAVVVSGSFSPDFSIITCSYTDSAVCSYSFATSQLTSGPSDQCGTSLLQEDFQFACPTKSGANVRDGTFNDDNSILSCSYDDEETCDYLFPEGELKTGANCPGSLFGQGTIGFGAAASGGNAAAAGSALLETNASSGSSATGSNGTTISKPILIALLAINGLLVVVVLAIASVWAFGRRRSEPQPRLRALSTGSGYRTVESVSVPLTHGDDGQYYDPPKRSS